MATEPVPAPLPARRDRSAIVYRIMTAIAFAATAAMLFLPAGARPPGL